ncbi:MAG: radical SAM protein, partial [Methylococcales bacterium]|nr:radical SAM protein [Methylococcales bacterium]
MSVLYSHLKYLRFQDHLDALRQKQVVAPVHVRIKPNNHCNHHCWYCAYRADNLQLGDEMDLKDEISQQKMFEIIDDLIDMKVKAVTFSGGGEPLIYKPIAECVERLAKGNIRVAALTNGSNLKGKVATAFAKYATWLRISVDAWDNDSYQESRGVAKGSFDKLLKNIINFVKTGTDCVLGVSFIIDNKNYQHVYEACEIFKEAGASHIKLSGVVTGNSVEENNQYHLPMKHEVSEQIERAKSLNDDAFSVVNHYHELSDRFEKNYQYCPFLQYLTIIGADECVYTCQDKAYTSSGLLGSIQQQSFKQFWFSEENKQQLLALNPSEQCNHHCITHTKNLSILEYLS